MKNRMRERPLGILITAGTMLFLGIFGGALQAIAQEQSSETAIQADVEELSRQVGILAEEVERLRSGELETEFSSDRAREMGLGASAASVYGTPAGVSIAGYGEMLLERFGDKNESGTHAGEGSRWDFYRAVFYFGFRFNEKFLFNSELEVEHANEISIEFAYIDYLAHPALTLRGGMLLVPMGLTNEFHEPTAFLSARRAETERKLIPSTWRENGFGAVGTFGKVSYRAYVLNGLDATGFSADGLRGGRQKGSKAKASDLGFVGRLDVTPVPGIFLGGSLYVGDSSQDQLAIAGEPFSVVTTIGELHSQANIRGFDIRGLYARSRLNNAAQLSAARNLTGVNGVGEVQQGGYIQFGYNLMSQFRDQIELTPFYRFEKLDTQARVASGFLKNAAMDRTFQTFGVSFKPIPNLAIKTDYQVSRNQAGSGLNQFSLALGYSF